VVAPGDIDRLLPGPDGSAGASAAPGGTQTFETFKQEAEKNFLIQKLREHDWNVSETARALKMPRSNLYKKIERYGLSREPA
jgi:two-component system nitrogen regulation response regulator NtrX